MDLGIALEGFFFEKVNGSTGQRVTFTFHYIIYAPASCHTLQRLLLLAAVPQSNSAPFARRVLHCISTVYIGGPGGVLFLKGQRVDGSTGQWVKRVEGSHLNGLCRWTSQLPLRGSFSKRSTGRRLNESNGSTGQRVTFTFHYIIYAPASCHTLQRLLLLAAVPQSNSAPFARRVLHCISTVYIGGPGGVLFLKGQRVDGSTGQWVKRVDGSHLNGLCRWTSQLPLRGSFSKRSTGRRLNESNGSTGQWVTFTFTILYMIADDARLTPPCCKKHTAYDDTRLTLHLDG